MENHVSWINIFLHSLMSNTTILGFVNHSIHIKIVVIFLGTCHRINPFTSWKHEYKYKWIKRNANMKMYLCNILCQVHDLKKNGIVININNIFFGFKGHALTRSLPNIAWISWIWNLPHKYAHHLFTLVLLKRNNKHNMIIMQTFITKLKCGLYIAHVVFVLHRNKVGQIWYENIILKIGNVKLR